MELAVSKNQFWLELAVSFIHTCSAKPPLPHPVFVQSVPWSQAQISQLSPVHFTFEVQAVTPAG